MKCVGIPSAKLRERIPLREDKHRVFSLLNGQNSKVILGIQHYTPEAGEGIKPHYAFCEDVGAALTLLSEDDFKQYETLEEAYELGIARILCFAQQIVKP
ncbi:MAG: hypothetical protein HRU41_24570 [Saprospiraceae bacterium]|nr:hypothetical protein [Saprospiraceae bacterium]